MAGVARTLIRQTLSPVEVSVIARKLLEMGYSARAVRRRLSEQGLHWEYGFVRHSGTRERLRRLNAAGMGLCSTCHAAGYLLDSPVNVCPACLDAKYDPSPTVRRPGHGSSEN